jgi:SAM-dependent methyltransferase
MKTLDHPTAEYHLSELQIAQDAHAPGHLLPPIPPGCRAVLDIGCGAGQTLIACRLDESVIACGVDPDAGALALGRTLTSRVQFGAAAGEQLPFAAESFDLVFSRVALPYMDIPQALAEIRRVLRPGGAVWFSLHPPRFAARAIAHAIRAGSVRGTVFPVYSLLNGLALHLFNRQARWPFGRKRFESNQTAAGMRRALVRAGFTAVSVADDRFFVVSARKA